jgi:hypothetical protein
MGKKSKKLVEWRAEEQAKIEAEKPPTREQLEKSFLKPKPKRPMIGSSHR